MAAVNKSDAPIGCSEPVHKPIIGLTGGIGAGKSKVAQMLADLGSAVIDADQIGHEVLDRPEVIAAVRGRFPGGVIGPDGLINRESLSRIVFSSPEERTWLETLVHPLIAGRRDELIGNYLADPAVRAIVLDAPLLVETGWYNRCDALIFVDCEPVRRVERVRQTRGWTTEMLRQRENFQKSLDLKRRLADYIIDNNSSLDHCRKQLEAVFSAIISPG